MRPSTLFSLLATSLALLSQSPIAFAAPIPSPVDSVGVKRCVNTGCRIAEPSNADATPQSTDLRLAAALISALQAYQEQYGTSDPNPVTDFATPSEPSGDGPTTDGSPTVDIELLAGDAL